MLPLLVQDLIIKMLNDLHFFFQKMDKFQKIANTLLHTTKGTQSTHCIFALLTFLSLFQNKEQLGKRYKFQKTEAFHHAILDQQRSVRSTVTVLFCPANSPFRIWLAVIDFQYGEQQSRFGSDKKRGNRLQQIHNDPIGPIGLINRAKRQVQTFDIFQSETLNKSFPGMI